MKRIWEILDVDKFDFLALLILAGLMYVFYVSRGTTRTTLTVIFYLAALCKVVAGWLRICHTAKVWGDPKEYYYKMKACDRKTISPIRHFIAMSATITIIMFLLSIFIDKHWFPLAACAFGLYFEGMAVRRQPPLVLFLSSSINNVSRQLHASLTRVTLLFHQTQSLIKIQKNQSMYDALSKQSNWRTFSDEDWKTVAFELMALAKIIVLDVRFPTPAAIEEAVRLAEMKMIFKTVLVVGKDASQPLVDALEENVTEAFQEALRLPEEKAIILVRRIVKQPNSLPTIQTPLSHIMGEMFPDELT
ncbi:hypothetical protein ACFL5Z_03085 [Planctomycetota bacterium]